MGRSRWLLSSVAVVLVHCGSTEVQPRTPDVPAVVADATVDARAAEDLPTTDVSKPDTASDVLLSDASTPDTTPVDASPDAAVDAQEEAGDVAGEAAVEDAAEDVPALDAAPDGGVELPDITLVEDIPMLDADVPAADVAPSPDAGPLCPLGITDGCPATAPGPCAPLQSGAARTVRFTGLTADVASSCEGSLTRGGRDGLVPLVVTAPSDLTVTAQPSSGDLAVLALYRASACGLPSGELRCVNPGRLGETARVTATSLEPGTYYLAVTSLLGNPVTLYATITPARPRRRGDVCPGVPITPDAPPTMLSTAGFQASADYGTLCGAASSSTSWTDAVFSYTLSAARDVTVLVSASGSGDLAVDVTSACGARSAAVPPCATGPTVRRVIRNQQPGTWYVAVDHRATGTGRTLPASVTTSSPTRTDPADRCPGVALTEDVAMAMSADRLLGDALIPCVRNQRGDGYFTFAAPAADRDVLVNLRGTRDTSGFQLQSVCGGAAVDACVSGGEREAPNLWARYRGLTPGAVYTIAVGTSQSTDGLSLRYLTVPTATPQPASGNTSCGRATTIPSTGGLFTGTNTAGDRNLSAACGGPACLGGRGAYYRLTLTERRRVVINTLGSGFDTVVNVLSGDCPGRAVDGACSDDALGTAALADVTLDAGSYVVLVGGCGVGAQGSYALDVAVLAP